MCLCNCWGCGDICSTQWKIVCLSQGHRNISVLEMECVESIPLMCSEFESLQFISNSNSHSPVGLSVGKRKYKITAIYVLQIIKTLKIWLTVKRIAEKKNVFLCLNVFNNQSSPIPHSVPSWLCQGDTMKGYIFSICLGKWKKGEENPLSLIPLPFLLFLNSHTFTRQSLFIPGY